MFEYKHLVSNPIQTRTKKSFDLCILDYLVHFIIVLSYLIDSNKFGYFHLHLDFYKWTR